MIIYNLLFNGTIYLYSPDGELYYSIAENFVNNGHFIQTARPYEVSFVVPPGLPLVYTILYCLLHNINAVILIQYVLFGITALFFKEIVKELFDNEFFSYIGLALFIGNRVVIVEANPAYLLTEPYTLLLSVIWIYFFVLRVDDDNEKWRLTALWLFSFVLFIIRPALSIFYVFSCVIIIKQVFKKVYSIKRFLALAIIMAMFLLINIGVNYRETGTFVFLENYSGIAVYEANNPNTKVYAYSSDLADDFTEERFWGVEADENLTRGEKSEIYKEWVKEYIKTNPMLCLKNTLKKLYYMFIAYYHWDFYLSILAFVLMRKEERRRVFVPCALTGICAAITSIGLNISRYSLCAVPIYALMKTAFIFIIFRFFYDKKTRMVSAK